MFADPGKYVYIYIYCFYLAFFSCSLLSFGRWPPSVLIKAISLSLIPSVLLQALVVLKVPHTHKITPSNPSLLFLPPSLPSPPKQRTTRLSLQRFLPHPPRCYRRLHSRLRPPPCLPSRRPCLPTRWGEARRGCVRGTYESHCKRIRRWGVRPKDNQSLSALGDPNPPSHQTRYPSQGLCVC